MAVDIRTASYLWDILGSTNAHGAGRYSPDRSELRRALLDRVSAAFDVLDGAGAGSIALYSTTEIGYLQDRIYETHEVYEPDEPDPMFADGYARQTVAEQLESAVVFVPSELA